ncbi:MAG TPA: DMT family transporter [Alphaproteobacteria bacterium]|nr:DMT family transporter [Alphaproteobacteria bacterium]
MRRVHDRLDATAVALMLALCATWGLNQVAVKIANAGISPILQAGLRSLGAACLVWLWSALRGVPLTRSDGSLAMGLLVGLMFGVEFALIYVGLEYTSASRSVIFLYTAPFVVAIGSHRYVPGERLRALQVIGLTAAFAGVALAVADGLTLPSRRELVGDLMVLAAGIIWGATTVVVKASRLIAISPNKTLLYQLAVSGMFLVPLSLLMTERGVFAPTALVLGSLAFQTILVAFITYLAWFWLITSYPAGRLAVFSFLTPLIGMAAGALILGERITTTLVLAAALVALGIYLVNRPVPAAA